MLNLAELDITSHVGGARTWVRCLNEGLSDLCNITRYRLVVPRDDKTSSRIAKTVDGLVQQLRRHDAVFMTSTFHYEIDNSARRLGTEPVYVSAAREVVRSGIPFAVMLHQAVGSYAPWMSTRSLLQIATVVITNQAGFSSSHIPSTTRVKNLPLLPYTRRLQDLTLMPKRRGVLMLGRVRAAKGQHVLIRVARHIRADVAIAGVTYNSFRASGSKDMWQLAVQCGYTPEGAEPEQGQAWCCYAPNGYKLQYLGAYEDPRTVLCGTQYNVSLNLTSADHSPGHLEYVTLECMDAGVTCVVPSHSCWWNPEVGLYTTEYFGQRHFNESDLVGVINRALDQAPTTGDVYGEYLKLHDPRVYANDVLRALLGDEGPATHDLS